jgi:hypothetical protein
MPAICGFIAAHDRQQATFVGFEAMKLPRPASECQKPVRQVASPVFGDAKPASVLPKEAIAFRVADRKAGCEICICNFEQGSPQVGAIRPSIRWRLCPARQNILSPHPAEAGIPFKLRCVTQTSTQPRLVIAGAPTCVPGSSQDYNRLARI